MPHQFLPKLLFGAALATLAPAASAQVAPQQPAAADVALPPAPFGLSQVRQGAAADRHVDWWRRARVGMFIHFGLYAIPARGEWVMFNESIPYRDYAKYADRFKPRPDAPKEWAELAKDAGLKYVVLTARHHDGFSLFDSRANPYNTQKTAAQQDIVREFVTAVRQEGLRVGLYYSPLDWRYPGYFMPDLYTESAEKMREQYHREIAQLSTDYGKIDLLWYDGGSDNWLGFGGIEFGDGWHSRDKSKPYAGRFSWQDAIVDQQLHRAQPDILINDRVSVVGDWRTREGWRALGDYNDTQPWELCITLAGSWGYIAGAKPASLKDLLQIVSKTASRDGNLLINVGPAPDGSVPADQVARMKELGAWLGSNGEAIYATRGGPFLPTSTTGSTRSGRTVYLHLLEDAAGKFPAKVSIPALDGGAKLVGAKMLNEAGALPAISRSGTTSILTIPQASSSTPVRIVKLTYSSDIMMQPARAME